jgi:hypothetical protein
MGYSTTQSPFSPPSNLRMAIETLRREGAQTRKEVGRDSIPSEKQHEPVPSQETGSLLPQRLLPEFQQCGCGKVHAFSSAHPTRLAQDGRVVSGSQRGGQGRMSYLIKQRGLFHRIGAIMRPHC